MSESFALTSYKRDLRASSVPRLRRSFQHAKYGGEPPHDAFKTVGLFQVKPGKAHDRLTRNQRYRVAQGSVGSLIGKRVNKHNQRTGERDPWNYWGRGKKWAKQMASGKDVDTGTAVGIYLDEEIEAKEIYAIGDPRLEAAKPSSGLDARCTSASLSPEANAGNNVNETMEIKGAVKSSEMVKQESPPPKLQGNHGNLDTAEESWHLYEDDLEGDWDLVSIHSV